MKRRLCLLLACLWLLPVYAETTTYERSQLQHFSLEGKNLRGVSFERSKLKDVNFRNADLTNTNFEYAELENCDFRGANMSGANLERARFVNSDFRGVNVKGANLDWARFPDSKIAATDFTKASSTDAADFNNADRQTPYTPVANSAQSVTHESTPVRISNSGLSFENATLQQDNFENKNLAGVSFFRAKLYRVNFRNADLRQANFEYADLKECDLRGALVRAANFTRASFDGTKLAGVDFSASNMERANMDKADFTSMLAVSAKNISLSLQDSSSAKINLAINFDYNKDTLQAQGMSQLEELSKALKNGELSNIQILIEGHTDSVGSDGYNMDLSERRAMRVKRVLSENFGIASNRLQTKGYGESKPISSNETEFGRAQNRRVTIVNLSLRK